MVRRERAAGVVLGRRLPFRLQLCGPLWRLAAMVNPLVLPGGKRASFLWALENFRRLPVIIIAATMRILFAAISCPPWLPCLLHAAPARARPLMQVCVPEEREVLSTRFRPR